MKIVTQKHIYQILSLLAFLLLLISFSCKNNPKQISSREIKQYKEPLVKVNKILVEKDRIRIEKFAQRRNWKMQTSETGLYFIINGNSTGEKAKESDLVTIKYRLSLLDGTICYSTDSLGPESFVVGHEDIEPGLDEGIRLMKKGQKAKLILPPHLAYGLLGDQAKIPPRSIILIELELVDIYRE